MGRHRSLWTLGQGPDRGKPYLAAALMHTFRQMYIFYHRNRLWGPLDLSMGRKQAFLAHNEPPVLQGNGCLDDDIGLHVCLRTGTHPVCLINSEVIEQETGTYLLVRSWTLPIS